MNTYNPDNAIAQAAANGFIVTGEKGSNTVTIHVGSFSDARNVALAENRLNTDLPMPGILQAVYDQAGKRLRIKELRPLADSGVWQEPDVTAQGERSTFAVVATLNHERARVVFSRNLEQGRMASETDPQLNQMFKDYLASTARSR
ncbi:MAG: hypothetical protein AB7F82_05555 [Alphaproteobacteria bacterium]